MAGELTTAPSGANQIMVVRQPVGIAVLVTPWNFPAAMATRKIGPGAGRRVHRVLKPAWTPRSPRWLMGSPRPCAPAGRAASPRPTAPDRRAGSTLTTPAGTPASSRICAIASAVSGVSLAGLRTTVQPAASAGPDLAGRHRGREVPRRHQHGDADRLLQHQDLVRPGRRRHHLAGRAHRLLGVPAEELGGVGDLAAGVGAAPCRSPA